MLLTTFSQTKKIIARITTASIVALTSGVTTLLASPLKEDEHVIFFPSNAYLDQSKQFWHISIHGWVFEPEENAFFRTAFINGLASLLEIDKDNTSNDLFKQRASMFIVDNERNKEINIEVEGQKEALSASSSNGHFQHTIKIKKNKLQHTDEKKWLKFKTINSEHGKIKQTYYGEVQLLPPTGISVISDIDDTIKHSDVTDKKALLENTFLKDFKPIGGMEKLFTNWQQQGFDFHYLSASPWQLFPTLNQFINSHSFPKGSFHLKLFRVKDESIFNLLNGPEEHKLNHIKKIISTYPERQFILVGDSGQKDPEIYAKIAKKYPNNIIHIFIREVDNTINEKRYNDIFINIESSRWTVFNDPCDIKNTIVSSGK